MKRKYKKWTNEIIIIEDCVVKVVTVPSFDGFDILISFN